MKTWHYIAWVLWVLVVALASYALNGPEFSTWYGSDQAVQVLMANDFCWPRDLYYWRQNRLGSIVPMVGNLIHLLGVPTITATGIAKYLFLGLGYFMACRFLRTFTAKFLLAIPWFYALSTFHNWTSLGHPYAENTALILTGFALMQFHFNRQDRADGVGQMVAFFIPLIWMLAFWVSELTLALLPAIMLFTGFHWIRQSPKTETFGGRVAKIWKHPNVTPIILGLALGIWFVYHAKHFAYPIEEYSRIFADAGQLADMLKEILHSTWSFLIFGRNNPVHSMAAWGMVVTALLLLLKGLGQQRELRVMQLVLSVAAVSMFGAVFVAYWSNNPDPALRHYTGIFPICWLIGLMEMERWKGKWRTVGLSLATVTALLTAGSGYWHRTYTNKGAQPYKVALGIRELGKANLIGEYWKAYLLASASPDSIIATAPEGYTVRRSAQAHRLVKEPHVYLVKDRWLETFPDSIIQFDRLLILEGEPFEMASSILCRYRTAELPERR